MFAVVDGIPTHEECTWTCIQNTCKIHAPIPDYLSPKVTDPHTGACAGVFDLYDMYTGHLN